MTKSENKNLKTERPPIKDAFVRCLSLRCPACGGASIVQRPFIIAERCRACGVNFKREEGFFVGALLISIVFTEAVILLVYLISIPFLHFDSQKALVVLFVIAVSFPVAFYHHGWSLWLTLDHFVEPLPKN